MNVRKTRKCDGESGVLVGLVARILFRRHSVLSLRSEWNLNIFGFL
jgi:hypothetical protein